MSQRNVEQVIGRLVTDEEFRHRFIQNARGTLQDLAHCWGGLSESELNALVSINPQLLARFADAIDPRLQKTDLQGRER